MAMAGPSYFYEDEVFRIGKSGEVEFGMVTENWEMYSSDEETDPEKVPHGHVAVTWHPKGKEDVIQESKVKLSDRSLMPGDVVRRLIAGKDTQRGYCRSVKVAAAVQIMGTKKVVTNVLASDLQPVQKFQSEVAVYLDSWIGVIRNINYRLSVTFPDNSACTVDTSTSGIMENFDDTRRGSEGFNSSDLFYPGQKLKGPMKCLKDADWSYRSEDMKRAKDRKMVTVLVTDVQPISMNVQWQWQTPDSTLENPNKDDPSWQKNPPSETVKGEEMKRVKCLNIFDCCTVQLGDISYYTHTPKDIIVERHEWKKIMASGVLQPQADRLKSKSQTSLDVTQSKDANADNERNETNNKLETKENKESTLPTQLASKKSLPKVCTRALRKKKLKKARQQPLMPLVLESKRVVETIHTRSTVDVVWQDGTYEEGLSSIDLYPIHHLDDHEFFPGDFVVRVDTTEYRIYGVIQSMDHGGRVASVKWFEAYSFTGEQKPKELDECEMSVYDIKDHPDFRYRPGTIVIRVANMLPHQYSAGQILDCFPDGQVRVWWANTAVSSCWPQDLFRLGDYDSDEGEIWDDAGGHSDNEEEEDDAASDSSWVTETEEENETDSNRYLIIGRLMENIQKALVSTREAIITSTPVSIDSATAAAQGDSRGITKKLLQIYKDCQYLDKLMGAKHFDEDFLKNWYKQLEGASNKSGRMTDQVSRLFDDATFKVTGVGTPPRSLSKSKISSDEDEKCVESKKTELVRSPSTSKADMFEGYNNPSIVSELCTVILNKLLAAHSEYESRFGPLGGELKVKESQTTQVNISTADLFTEPGCKYLKAQGLLSHLEKTMSKLQSGEFVSNVLGVLAERKDVVEVRSKESVDNANVSEISTPEEVNVTPKTVEVEKLPETHLAPKETIEEPLVARTSNCIMVENVPDTHRYRLTTFQPQNQRNFLKTVYKEVALLRENLPDGILVKGFEDRMDLFSVMISGPENTPYEDGLFLFDIQLPSSYPSSPPLVHYVSFCPDRLNPNLYEEGKVCVSLLGTWSGKGSEMWTEVSSLLQLLVSIQGLILVPEPYFNEAGYEKQRGSQQGQENSRMYNEMVLIKLVQSMSRMMMNLHLPWEAEISQYIRIHGPRMIERCNRWLALPEASESPDVQAVEVERQSQPGFPLLPVSKGFSITLKKTLDNFAKLCDSSADSSSSDAESSLTVVN